MSNTWVTNAPVDFSKAKQLKEAPLEPSVKRALDGIEQRLDASIKELEKMERKFTGGRREDVRDIIESLNRASMLISTFV